MSSTDPLRMEGAFSPQFQSEVRRYFMPKRKPEGVEEQEDEIIWIGTGSTLLDLNVGGGRGNGYPSGAIINIVGDKSSGKTFLACEIIANAFHMYREKLKWKYDDAESGFTFNTKLLYGIEIMPQNPKERFKSRTVQQLEGNVRLFLESLSDDEFGIYVVDSLDGLSSEEIEDRADKRFKAFKQGKELTAGSYQMEAAKFLSQEFFRTLTSMIQKKRVLLIFISQIRYAINAGPFQKQWTRAGGKALDFYAYNCLWLKTIHKLKRKEVTIGVLVEAYSDKLKAPKPMRKNLVTFIFDYGIDDIGANIDYLFDLRGKDNKLLKAAQEILWSPESAEKNRGELIEMVENDPDMKKELVERVRKKWNDFEDSIASNRKPKYGALDE